MKKTENNLYIFILFSFQLKDKERVFIQRWGIFTENIEN